MPDLVLAFTRTEEIWLVIIGLIISTLGLCFFVGGEVLKRYTNKHIGRKADPLERRAELLFLGGMILLGFCLPVNILLLVLQVIPASARDFVTIIALVIVFVGGVLELWAVIIRTIIARQRKL